MAKKATFFLSAFLLFFCFGLVSAQEMRDQSVVDTPEIKVESISEDIATTTETLIMPLIQTDTQTKQATISMEKDQELSKVCSVSKCRIPIPTLKNPNGDNFTTNKKVYLTGLTWNGTIIDVYVDGNFIGQAVVKDDTKSNTANFYYDLDISKLSIGEHKWSVIAWSANKRDRSFVSKENIFTISDVVIKPIIDKEPIKEETKQEEESTSSISEQREDVGVVSPEIKGDVSISEDKSDAGVNVSLAEENNMLVVDKDKESEESVNKSEDTEKLQDATPTEEVKQEVTNDLDVNKVQDSNRKIGIVLLAILVFFVGFSSIVFRKKK